MSTPRQYDLIVIGSGQGGNPLAMVMARAGRKTALVEREHVGGTCINEGCTPTKTLIASGREAYLARRSADYGIHTGSVSVSMSEVIERKRDIVRSFRTKGEHNLDSAGVDVFGGDASFTGPHTIQVRPRPVPGAEEEREPIELTAGIIVIDTGSRPATPPIRGIETVPHLNSTTIMELEELPEHLLVLGGGYVGLEFAQLFRRLGSQVTIVQQGPRLAGREDPDVADEIAKILRQDGIEILLDTSAQAVERNDNGEILLTVQGPDGDRTLHGSHLLVAAGRTPNSDTLDLEAAGVERDQRGFIRVDDRLETAVPGVYAIGDVAGTPAFTHMSYDDYRILRANLLEGGNRSRKDRLVPYTMFIDPQLGRVGLSEEEARAQGRDVRVAKIPMTHVARAIEVSEVRGMVKAVIDADTGQILGCAILGIEGGEIMAMMEIAMLGKLPYTVLRDAIFAHPTLAELLNTLFTALDDSAPRRHVTTAAAAAG